MKIIKLNNISNGNARNSDKVINLENNRYLDRKNSKNDVEINISENNYNDNNNYNNNNQEKDSSNYDDYIPPEVDESLATFKENANYNFDPHNYQSYYNHIQVVGGHHFKKEYMSIYLESQYKGLGSNRSMINGSVIEDSNVNRSQVASKVLANNNFEDTIIIENSNFKHKSSVINAIQRDEMPLSVTTGSFKEIIKQEQDDKQEQDNKHLEIDSPFKFDHAYENLEVEKILKNEDESKFKVEDEAKKNYDDIKPLEGIQAIEEVKSKDDEKKKISKNTSGYKDPKKNKACCIIY